MANWNDVTAQRQRLGCARVSRVGFGFPPKQSFLKPTALVKVHDDETLSPTRETRALPGFARHAK
jgi:hypothetical protein